MNGITTVLHDVDAACPVVGFVNSLLDESFDALLDGLSPGYPDMTERLRCFEMEHRIYRPRCRAFAGEEV
jgi:hypothetical protein